MRKHTHKLTLAVTLASVMVVGGVAGFDTAAQAGPVTALTDIDGIVTRVADEGNHTPGAHRSPVVGDTILHTADGTSVHLDGAGVDTIETGTRLRATVAVPDEVVDAVRDNRPVTTDTGTQVEVDRADLLDARDGTPTLAGSSVSAASAASSVSTGEALATTGVRVLAAAPEAGNTTPVHELTVAVVVPRGATAQVASSSAIRAQVAAASTYWSDMSRGAITMRVATISDPYYSAYDCSDPFRLWSEAARRTQFTEGRGKHLVLSLPRSATNVGCSYGLASIGSGLDAGGVALVSDSAWPVLAHEMGHNFGLGHAKSFECMRADAAFAKVPAGCWLNEYGYPWSVMAASAPDRAGALSSAQSSQIGLMPATDLVRVTSGSRAVTLKPYAGGLGSGVRAVRVVDPVSKFLYFIEYRAHVGRDRKLYADVPDGIRIVTVDETVQGAAGEVVLDPSPTGRSNDNDRRLVPGKTFTSFTGGFTVTTRSVDAAGATVVVSVGGAGRRLASTSVRPGAVSLAAPTVDAAASARPDATLRWSGAPAGSVYDVQYRAVATSGSGSVTYGAARTWLSGTTRTSAVLRGAAGAVYQVSVRARNSAGSGSWSPWRTVTFATDAQSRGTRLAGRWQAGNMAGYYAGTYLATSVTGASYTRPATWTKRIDIVGPKHVQGASAAVYVDGRLRARINSYSSRTVARSVLASVSVPWGKHSVKVVSSTTRQRPTLVLDAVAFGR